MIPGPIGGEWFGWENEGGDGWQLWVEWFGWESWNIAVGGLKKSWEELVFEEVAAWTWEGKLDSSNKTCLEI